LDATATPQVSSAKSQATIEKVDGFGMIVCSNLIIGK
jgi:hypothetical protein